MFEFQCVAWPGKTALPRLLFIILFLAGCSKSPQQLIKNGQKYMSEGKYGEAAIEFRNAVKNDPQSADAHYQLAVVFAAISQLPASADELTKTLSLQPNHIDAQLMLGNELLLKRQFDDARAKADTVLTANPKNTRARIL